VNYIEAEYAKMERRVKKIRENPDPTKLKATGMLYELEMELRAHELEAWKEGRPFCFGPNFPALITSMGFEYLPIQNEADRVTNADKYFDILRTHGYPDYHCDRTIIGVGMVLAQDVPVPAMTVAVNQACDPIMLMGHTIGQYYSPHHFCIDIDAVHNEPTERLLQYTTNQLGEWIEFAEARVPGIKYNEDRMLELTEMDKQACDYLRDIYELRKRSPCPLSGQDVFRLPRNPSQFPNPQKCVDYYRTLRDEIGERADKGLGAVKEEKVRIMWTITAPFFADVFKLLENQGASVVHFQVGGAARFFGTKGYYGDDSEYGRKLTPLEDQARVLTMNSWAGLANRWVDDTIYFCKELNVDGIVNFEQWGCVAAVLTRKVLQDRVEAELGIPNLFVEGRNLDTSTFDIEDFRERMEHFVGVCVDRKAQRTAA
jgi:benzoyl-CoA reductase/2-hydroxyglutaryl-CoA dehydratase subunit BcrC/BadD/HgdB